MRTLRSAPEHLSIREITRQLVWASIGQFCPTTKMLMQSLLILAAGLALAEAECLGGLCKDLLPETDPSRPHHKINRHSCRRVEGANMRDNIAEAAKLLAKLETKSRVGPSELVFGLRLIAEMETLVKSGRLCSEPALSIILGGFDNIRGSYPAEFEPAL